MRANGQRSVRALSPGDLYPGAVVRLTDRKRKQAESVSGYDWLARRKMIEADPSIPNPYNARPHVISDMRSCSEFSPFIVDFDRIAIRQLPRVRVRSGYPEPGIGVVPCQRR